MSGGWMNQRGCIRLEKFLIFWDGEFIFMKIFKKNSSLIMMADYKYL